MRDCDCLPAELRSRIATAMLPWWPGSVRRACDTALAATGIVALRCHARPRGKRGAPT
jgi:hypothetical protein